MESCLTSMRKCPSLLALGAWCRGEDWLVWTLISKFSSIKFQWLIKLSYYWNWKWIRDMIVSYGWWSTRCVAALIAVFLHISHPSWVPNRQQNQRGSCKTIKAQNAICFSVFMSNACEEMECHVSSRSALSPLMTWYTCNYDGREDSLFESALKRKWESCWCTHVQSRDFHFRQKFAEGSVSQSSRSTQL